MADATADRKTLEALWRLRLSDAKRHLDFARKHVQEVERDLFSSPGIPTADGNYAYRKAIRSETLALWKYNHILHVYRDLQ